MNMSQALLLCPIHRVYFHCMRLCPLCQQSGTAHLYAHPYNSYAHFYDPRSRPYDGYGYTQSSNTGVSPYPPSSSYLVSNPTVSTSHTPYTPLHTASAGPSQRHSLADNLNHIQPTTPSTGLPYTISSAAPSLLQSSATARPGVSPDGIPNPRTNPVAFAEMIAPEDLKLPLCHILQSQWFVENQHEPNRELEKLIIEAERNEWKCPFAHCTKPKSIWKKKQRAIDHIRTHINHRPFQCGGHCKRSDCTQAFCSQRDLDSHLKPKFVECDRCGQVVDSRNIKRHHETQICQGNQGA